MSEEIFRIRKDPARAKSVFEIAKDRFGLINIYPKDKVYKIIEEYYETIKEMIVSLMYLEGWKTLSHIEMVNWLNKNYSLFSETEIKLIDNVRKLRNGTLYYGENINKIFLENNEKKIRQIVEKLIKIIKDKI